MAKETLKDEKVAEVVRFFIQSCQAKKISSLKAFSALQAHFLTILTERIEEIGERDGATSLSLEVHRSAYYTISHLSFEECRSSYRIEEVLEDFVFDTSLSETSPKAPLSKLPLVSHRAEESVTLMGEKEANFDPPGALRS